MKMLRHVNEGDLLRKVQGNLKGTRKIVSFGAGTKVVEGKKPKKAAGGTNNTGEQGKQKEGDGVGEEEDSKED